MVMGYFYTASNGCSTPLTHAADWQGHAHVPAVCVCLLPCGVRRLCRKAIHSVQSVHLHAAGMHLLFSWQLLTSVQCPYCTGQGTGAGCMKLF